MPGYHSNMEIKSRSSEEKRDVTIVIPTRNEEANIGKCLEAIFDQDTGCRFEVIVIDSGSTDKTLEIVRRCPGVRLIQIRPEEFGHGKTRNLGADLSDGEFIVFLNADALPVNQNWLTPLLDCLKRDGQVAACFSRHIPRKDCDLYMVRDIQDSMPEQPMVRARVGSLDFMIFSTVSAAVRKEVWQEYPFNRDILIAEDQDWARQIIERGYKIAYVPDSLVYHSHNYSLGELFTVKLKVGRSTRRFKDRFRACLLGFPLILAGILVKIWGDLVFIFIRNPEKMSFAAKVRQMGLAVAARIVGFAGRYVGWVGK